MHKERVYSAVRVSTEEQLVDFGGKTLLACTIGFGQLWCDPLGLNESAGETSYDTFSNFCTPLVNPTTWDEIVIFTLREKDMERHGKL